MTYQLQRLHKLITALNISDLDVSEEVIHITSMAYVHNKTFIIFNRIFNNRWFHFDVTYIIDKKMWSCSYMHDLDVTLKYAKGKNPEEMFRNLTTILSKHQYVENKTWDSYLDKQPNSITKECSECVERMLHSVPTAPWPGAQSRVIDGKTMLQVSWSYKELSLDITFMEDETIEYEFWKKIDGKLVLDDSEGEEDGGNFNKYIDDLVGHLAFIYPRS